MRRTKIILIPAKSTPTRIKYTCIRACVYQPEFFYLCLCVCVEITYSKFLLLLFLTCCCCCCFKNKMILPPVVDIPLLNLSPDLIRTANYPDCDFYFRFTLTEASTFVRPSVHLQLRELYKDAKEDDHCVELIIINVGNTAFPKLAFDQRDYLKDARPFLDWYIEYAKEHRTISTVQPKRLYVIDFAKMLKMPIKKKRERPEILRVSKIACYDGCPSDWSEESARQARSTNRKLNFSSDGTITIRGKE